MHCLQQVKEAGISLILCLSISNCRSVGVDVRRVVPDLEDGTCSKRSVTEWVTCTMHHQQLPCASHAIARPAFACLRPLAPRRSRTHRSAAQPQPCTQHLASCANLQSSAQLLSNVGTQGRCGRASLTVTNSYSKPDVPDRVVASIPYLIPLIDGLRYGQSPLHSSN